MLFDERKYPYHLMLRDFLACGGLDAFFNTFQWVLTEGGTISLEQGRNNPEIPEGFSEFLESWLSLLEKMVNPKMILDTQHTMPMKSSSTLGYVPFDPIQYLIVVHKRAFGCLNDLWVKKPKKFYGEQMSEHILAVLCHLLKGEAVIHEHLSKEKDSENPSSGASNSGATANQVSTPTGQQLASRSDGQRRNELEDQGINPEHFQQLVDMGFSPEMAVDALMQSQTIEQATEYLLSTPSSTGTAPSRPSVVGQDVDMAAEENTNSTTATTSNATSRSQANTRPEQLKEEPLSKECINKFTDNILPGSLRLLDELPGTVYKICDLILTVNQRNGEKWCENLLVKLLNDIIANVKTLLELAEPMRSKDKRSFNEWTSALKNAPEAERVAVRVHLYSLLFEELKIPCANLLSQMNAIDSLVQLLEVALDLFTLSKDNSTESQSDLVTNASQTPKWLAPTILLIDLYEKGAVASQRRAPLLCSGKRTWRWFEDRTGRWIVYQTANNKAIDDAYKNGEQYARFMAGRRRYLANFSTMLQVNEESGNVRPIMLSVEDKIPPMNDNYLGPCTENSKVDASSDEIKQEQPSGTDEKQAKDGQSPIVQRLRQHQCKTLVRVCVGFMQLPIDASSLHAVMRLSFRLTRDYDMAVMFAEMGGIRAIQHLPESCFFNGFTSLATLIVRHVLEEPAVLRQTMEKVIRSTVQHCHLNLKEMHYILRALGPAACRNPKVFKQIATSVLRMAPSPLNKREEEESRKSEVSQILKLVQPKQVGEAIKPSNVTRGVIADLLDSLTLTNNDTQTRPTPQSQPTQSSSGQQAVSMTDSDASNSQSSLPHFSVRNPVAPNARGTIEITTCNNETLIVDEGSGYVLNYYPVNKSGQQQKPSCLMNHSVVLRLLAELTRSYSVVPKIISEHTYMPGTNDVITEETPALAFILDHILPTTQTHGDKDGPALARVFLAALAACNHCVEAQTAIVTEVKASLARAASMSESNDKHTRIQSLANMINTMIDCCPSVSCPQQPGQQPNATALQRGLSNNIVRLFVRKGLVTDLARLPHSLDLSAPNMAQTINSILKPLETLSRIVNLPSSLGNPRAQVGKTKTDIAEHAVANAIDEEPPVSDQQHQQQTPVSSEQPSHGNPADATAATNSNNSGANVDRTNNLHRSSSSNQPGSGTTDDNNDNVVIDSQVHFELYNDSPHHRSHTDDIMTPIGIREDQHFEAMNEDHQHFETEEVERGSMARDNVVNSNGAESESEEDSRSEEDDEDEDDEDHGEVSGVDEREEEDEDDDDEDDEDEEDDDDHADDDEDPVDDDDGQEDNLNGYGENAFGDEYRFGDNISSVLSDIEDVFHYQSNVFHYNDRMNNIIPSMIEDPLNHDTNLPTLPPPPGNVASSHPLLHRRLEYNPQLTLNTNIPAGHAIMSNRAHRASRPRLMRGNPIAGSSWPPPGGPSLRHAANAPHNILRQILGTNSAQDVVTLTSQIAAPSRLFVADFHNWLANPSQYEDDQYFETTDATNLVASSNPTTLASIPLVMSRWSEESRVLDGDSLHDCVTIVKQDIIEVLEKYKTEENLDRHEKRKKLVEDDEQAMKKYKEKVAQQQRQQQSVQQQQLVESGQTNHQPPTNSSSYPDGPSDPDTSLPTLGTQLQNRVHIASESTSNQSDSMSDIETPVVSDAPANQLPIEPTQPPTNNNPSALDGFNAEPIDVLVLPVNEPTNLSVPQDSLSANESRNTEGQPSSISVVNEQEAALISSEPSAETAETTTPQASSSRNEYSDILGGELL